MLEAIGSFLIKRHTFILVQQADMTANSPKLGLWTTTLAYLELLISILFSLLGLGLTNANYLRSTTIEAKTKSQISQVNPVCVKERKNLLRLLSWRMMAESVLFITHSSSLPMPSGSTPRHRCLGSMFLFTSGMTAAPYTAAAHSTCPDKTQTLYLNTHTRVHRLQLKCEGKVHLSCLHRFQLYLNEAHII